MSSTPLSNSKHLQLPSQSIEFSKSSPSPSSSTSSLAPSPNLLQTSNSLATKSIPSSLILDSSVPLQSSSADSLHGLHSTSSMARPPRKSFSVLDRDRETQSERVSVSRSFSDGQPLSVTPNPSFKSSNSSSPVIRSPKLKTSSSFSSNKSLSDGVSNPISSNSSSKSNSSLSLQTHNPPESRKSSSQDRPPLGPSIYMNNTTSTSHRNVQIIQSSVSKPSPTSSPSSNEESPVSASPTNNSASLPTSINHSSTSSSAHSQNDSLDSKVTAEMDITSTSTGPITPSEKTFDPASSDIASTTPSLPSQSVFTPLSPSANIAPRSRNTSGQHVAYPNPMQCINFRANDPAEWTLDRVSMWLEYNKFGPDWIETFRAKNIHGKEFLSLVSYQKLKDLGPLSTTNDIYDTHPYRFIRILRKVFDKSSSTTSTIISTTDQNQSSDETTPTQTTASSNDLISSSIQSTDTKTAPTGSSTLETQVKPLRAPIGNNAETVSELDATKLRVRSRTNPPRPVSVVDPATKAQPSPSSPTTFSNLFSRKHTKSSSSESSFTGNTVHPTSSLNILSTTQEEKFDKKSGGGFLGKLRRRDKDGSKDRLRTTKSATNLLDSQSQNSPDNLTPSKSISSSVAPTITFLNSKFDPVRPKISSRLALLTVNNEFYTVVNLSEASTLEEAKILMTNKLSLEDWSLCSFHLTDFGCTEGQMLDDATLTELIFHPSKYDPSPNFILKLFIGYNPKYESVSPGQMSMGYDFQPKFHSTFASSEALKSDSDHDLERKSTKGDEGVDPKSKIILVNDSKPIHEEIVDRLPTDYHDNINDHYRKHSDVASINSHVSLLSQQQASFQQYIKSINHLSGKGNRSRNSSNATSHKLSVSEEHYRDPMRSSIASIDYSGRRSSEDSFKVIRPERREINFDDRRSSPYDRRGSSVSGLAAERKKSISSSNTLPVPNTTHTSITVPTSSSFTADKSVPKVSKHTATNVINTTSSTNGIDTANHTQVSRQRSNRRTTALIPLRAAPPPPTRTNANPAPTPIPETTSTNVNTVSANSPQITQKPQLSRASVIPRGTSRGNRTPSGSKHQVTDSTGEFDTNSEYSESIRSRRNSDTSSKRSIDSSLRRITSEYLHETPLPPLPPEAESDRVKEAEARRKRKKERSRVRKEKEKQKLKENEEQDLTEEQNENEEEPKTPTEPSSSHDDFDKRSSLSRSRSNHLTISIEPPRLDLNDLGSPGLSKDLEIFGVLNVPDNNKFLKPSYLSSVKEEDPPSPKSPAVQLFQPAANLPLPASSTVSDTTVVPVSTTDPSVDMASTSVSSSATNSNVTISRTVSTNLGPPSRANSTRLRGGLGRNTSSSSVRRNRMREEAKFHENEISFEGAPALEDSDSSSSDEGLWAKKPPATTVQTTVKQSSQNSNDFSNDIPLNNLSTSSIPDSRKNSLTSLSSIPLSVQSSYSKSRMRPNLHLDISNNSAVSSSSATRTPSTGITSDQDTPNTSKSSAQQSNHPMSFADIKLGGWAVRPPAEVVYENLERFFPDADLDRPIILDPQGVSPPSSPASETTPPPLPSSVSKSRHNSYQPPLSPVVEPSKCEAHFEDALENSSHSPPIEYHDAEEMPTSSSLHHSSAYQNSSGMTKSQSGNNLKNNMAGLQTPHIGYPKSRQSSITKSISITPSKHIHEYNNHHRHIRKILKRVNKANGENVEGTDTDDTDNDEDGKNGNSSVQASQHDDYPENDDQKAMYSNEVDFSNYVNKNGGPQDRKAKLSMRTKSLRIVVQEATERRKRFQSLANLNSKEAINGPGAPNGVVAGGSPGVLLRRKSTKMWGQKVVEVKPNEFRNGASGGSQQLSRLRDNRGKVKRFVWVKGELIGKGTFGKVYLALNATAGEMIAVKQVEVPQTLSDKNSERQKEVIDALYAEVETMKDLDHFNIVQYLGFEALPDSYNLFLEYVPGGTVGMALRKHGRFEISVSQYFTRQVLDGLAYLHSCGILHRDLKSDNILIDLDGVCKISDFGISKKSRNIYANDAEMSMQGTIFWMAPEVIHNVIDNEKQGYSAKVDIWSLGCVVLEMFAGRRPWSTDEAIGAMYKLGNARLAPPIPEDTKPFVTDTGKDFLNQCFEIDPEKRPTAKKLLDHEFCVVDPNFRFSDTKLGKMIRVDDNEKMKKQESKLKK